jgi:hypothetical protein
MKKYTIFILAPEINGEVVAQTQSENLNGFFSLEKSFKVSIIHLMKCDFVVTFGDWADNSNFKKIIEIARIAEIPVIHQTRYQNYVEEQFS